MSDNQRPSSVVPERWLRHPRITGTTGVLAVLALAVVVALVTSSLVASRPTAADASLRTSPVSTAGFPSGGRNPGIFTDMCSRSLTAPNDPIMMPGMTGMSMQHDFFGNRAVTASSTPAKLVGGATTCSTTADASAYWTPVVYQNGTALSPQRTLIYWRAPATSASSVKTMPQGITMIAGNEAAQAPQSDKVVNWTCTPTRQGTVAGTGSAVGAAVQRPTASDAPHDCASGYLRLIITFPNCWDGHTLNGMTRQNVVYETTAASGTATACPASHPVQIPQIVLHVTYPTASGAAITLSTGPRTQGPPITGHADFMNGWNESTLTADVSACVATQTRCGRVTGPSATPRGGRIRAGRRE